MRQIMIVVLAVSVLLSCAAAVSAQTIDAEMEYLARAIATSYRDVSFGGKVAIAAVAINRTEEGYAGSLAGAVASLAAEGEFDGLGKTVGRIDGEVYRICEDAVSAAMAGADPTGGAICFRRLRVRIKADMRFDDWREDELDRKMRRELERLAESEGSGVTPILIDGIGFY